MNQNTISVQGSEPQPYIYVFRPAVAVAAGAASLVSLTNGPKQFVMTEIGFTSSPVGIPARGQIFRIFITDVGKQMFLQNADFNILALLGTNPFLNDQPSKALPVPWTWKENGQMTVNFTNVGTLACLPELLLIGYLIWPPQG
jgi:hypothetical protein